MVFEVLDEVVEESVEEGEEEGVDEGVDEGIDEGVEEGAEEDEEEAAEGVEEVVEAVVEDGEAVEVCGVVEVCGAAGGGAFFLKKKMITEFSSNPESLTVILSFCRTFPENTSCCVSKGKLKSLSIFCFKFKIVLFSSISI